MRSGVAFSQRGSAKFRSAGRRPGRASRPRHPFETRFKASIAPPASLHLNIAAILDAPLDTVRSRIARGIV